MKALMELKTKCKHLNVKWVLILSLILFVIFTLLLSDFSGIHDGLTRIGFPLVFMQDTGGKCVDCNSLKWFNIYYLIGDVFLCLLSSAIILRIICFLKKPDGRSDIFMGLSNGDNIIWLKKLKEKWLAENALSEVVTDDEYLTSFQKENEIMLSDDLKDYFKSLNGTGGHCTDGFYEFYSIDRVSKVKEEFKNWNGVPNYQDILEISNINELYVFANYSCNLFAYAIELHSEFSNKNEVYILCGDEYKKIANSFSEFIDLYLRDSIELQFSDED